MKQLLIEAKQEIQSLRRRNEILSARVDTMDLFERILYSSPAQPNASCMGEDLVWKIQQKLDEAELSG